MKTKQAYVNLIELWANNEELLYLISNPKGQIPREEVISYASPLSKRVLRAIKDGKFDEFDKFTKEQFITEIQEAQEDLETKQAKRTSLNLLNVNSFNINTLEFRGSNGTINANEWIENAVLYIEIVAFSQKLSDIQCKLNEDLTDAEIKIIKQFDLLTSKEVSEEERLDILLELCIPKNMRDIYKERYFVNKKIMEEHPEIRNELKKNILKERIKFITDASVINIASQSGVAQEKENTMEILNDLERDKTATMEYVV